MESLDETLQVRGMQQRLLLAGGLLAVGTVVYTFALCVYRLFLHPLAKFPGPWINAVSDVSPLCIALACTALIVK
jgi:hypothetical protein